MKNTMVYQQHPTDITRMGTKQIINDRRRSAQQNSLNKNRYSSSFLWPCGNSMDSCCVCLSLFACCPLIAFSGIEKRTVENPNIPSNTHADRALQSNLHGNFTNFAFVKEWVEMIYNIAPYGDCEEAMCGIFCQPCWIMQLYNQTMQPIPKDSLYLQENAMHLGALLNSMND